MSAIFWVSYALLWLVVIFLLLVTVEVVKRLALPKKGDSVQPNTPLFEPGFEIGEPAPAFTALDIGSGRLINSADLHGEPVLLAFIAPECASCRAAIPVTIRASEWTNARLVFVCTGSHSACSQTAASIPTGAAVLLDEGAAILQAFRVDRPPRAVLLDAAWQVVKFGTPGQLLGAEQA